MMDATQLLGQRHLSVFARSIDSELSSMCDVIEHKLLIDDRSDLEAMFCELLSAGGHAEPKTLDLVGHSTPDDSLLALGNWVIDSSSATVTAFFRGLADAEVLSRLGVTSLRLLGCETAASDRGRATLRALAEVLGVAVYGTNTAILAAHFDANGFRDDCDHALVSSQGMSGIPVGCGQPYRRVLDIDSLPSTPLVEHISGWPRRRATLAVAQRLLALVRRSDGAQMPGFVAMPYCELALPAPRSGWYYTVQVLLDGDFVRVYPDGDRSVGVVFPVDDKGALRAMIDMLPPV